MCLAASGALVAMEPVKKVKSSLYTQAIKKKNWE
jgi:hypothetical protein